MQFFKIEGFTVDKIMSEENENRKALREKIRKFAVKSDLFNQKLKNKAFYFITDASPDTVSVGAICRDHVEIEKKAADYLDAVGLKLKDVFIEEITLSRLCKMLHTALRNDYINDDDEVLESFDLDRLTCGYREGVDYGENIIDVSSKEEIFKQAERFLAKDSFYPELERVFAGSLPKRATGHPVHYFIQTDDHETCKSMYRLLLSALYQKGRIQSRRYCFIDFAPGDEFSDTVYDCLYKSCSGGAVIVRFSSDDESEDDRANGDRDTIESLCKTMKKHRNRVLTVFCLPRECTRAKDIFLENLGNLSFVELKEEFAYGERASDFLKMIAKENGVRTDKRLFEKIENDTGYLVPDLRAIFDEWYDRKLKNDLYPQYKEVNSVKLEVVKKAPKGNAYDELMEMIGINEAKQMMIKALNYYKAQKIFADSGVKFDRPAMHMIFTGNPGTAKTTVARLFARIMKENGLLSKGNLVEVGRGDIVGKYVGWTAPEIQKKFREAKGSVLFIDEAYSLVDDRDGCFGDEAINAIVQEMENHRDDVVVIFAGYPDKMEGFLRKNPGLRSRIAFHIPFADYETGDLCGIAKLIAKKKGLKLSPDALEKMEGIFEAAKNEEDFGNGRYVRNLIEQAKMSLMNRLLKLDVDQLSKDDISTIRADDIDVPPFAEKQRKKPIGFSAA